MSGHAPVEVLSGYLDRELGERQRRSLEVHLEGCLECRRRLDGLRRVVAGLGRLESREPPPYLGARVLQGLAPPVPERGLARRIAERTRRVAIQPVLLPAFATIFALAVILYLLAGVFDRGDGSRVTDPAAEPRVEGSAPAGGDTRSVAGRSFERIDGIWVERGAESANPEVVYAAAALLPPRLEPFAELGRVRLRDGARVVEINLPPAD